MTLRVRQLGAGLLLLATGVWFVGFGQAASEKELRDSIRKLAQSIEKKDADGAKKQATALGKSIDDMEDLMNMLSGRNGDKGGLGVGPKPGAITPDGIEDKIEHLAKKPLAEKQLSTEADALVQMGYDVAAVMAVAQAKGWQKEEGAKKKTTWEKFSKASETAALAFADAAKKKNPAEVQAAAKKLDNSCSTCHDIFKK